MDRKLPELSLKTVGYCTIDVGGLAKAKYNILHAAGSKSNLHLITTGGISAGRFEMKAASFCFILSLVVCILFNSSSADEPDQNPQLQDVISPPENGAAKQSAEQNKESGEEETANAGEEFLNEATRLKISVTDYFCGGLLEDF